MSLDLSRVGRVPAAAEEATAAGPAAPPSADRDRLKRIAQEFESMLLVQVLKDMRKAGSWEQDGESDAMPGGMGFESLFEHIDVELASHLSRVNGGFGLAKQLEQAFDRLGGTSKSQIPNPKSDAPAHDDHGHDSNPIVSAVKVAAEATVAAPKAVARWVKPVAGAVTSAFGWRQDPFTKELKFHKGVDLRAAYGQEVHAAAAGRVVFSGEQGGYGATVVVEHTDGSKTRYAHLSARTVDKGDRVEAGGMLGRAGRSGRATGTHLHFEVIAADGTRVAPRDVAGLLGS